MRKLSECSDQTLLRRIKSGDKGALEQLVYRWYPRIFGYVLRTVVQEQDAYDITHDTFLALMEHIESVQPGKNFKGWLFAIAHNRCMDHFRRKKPIKDIDSIELMSNVNATEESVENAVLIDIALHTLPTVQRETIVLHTMYGFTAKEIARMTDTPLPTVKSRIRAAKQKLVRELKEEQI